MLFIFSGDDIYINKYFRIKIAITVTRERGGWEKDGHTDDERKIITERDKEEEREREREREKKRDFILHYQKCKF